MNQFFNKIVPFIVLGISLFILIAGIVVLSYVLIFGAFIGFVLFTISWLREKFAPKKSPKDPKKVEQKGRIIDHDDI